MTTKASLHPRNKHRKGYDFASLVKANTALSAFVIKNKHNQQHKQQTLKNKQGQFKTTKHKNNYKPNSKQQTRMARFQSSSLEWLDMASFQSFEMAGHGQFPIV